MERIRFTKMEGIGNDYVYIDCIREEPAIATWDNAQLSSLAIKMSDRHFGIGGDGIILIMPSEKADFRMRMFNADGSEGKMCGNGSRCVAKYVYDRGLTSDTEVTLETLGGIKVLKMHLAEDGYVKAVTVDMGEPELVAANVPALTAQEKMIEELLETANFGSFPVTAVSMGNPHGVIFVDKITDREVHGAGPELEHHAAFPDRANIEFVEIISPEEIKMRVWERGSGETLACGTGACASAVAAVVTGRTPRKITVKLIGGDLQIEWNANDNHVYMTGGARIVFDGEYPISM